jgi:hypothetical protein
MSTHRTLHLVVYPGQAGQRAHFGIWVADEECGNFGSLIHVVGSPMTGFALQFRRRYAPKDDDRHPRLLRIGEIETQHVHSYEGESGEDTAPKGNLENMAARIQPPRLSGNFRVPVNDVSTALLHVRVGSDYVDDKSPVPGMDYGLCSSPCYSWLPR